MFSVFCTFTTCGVQPTERKPDYGQLQNLMNGFPGSMSNGPLFPMLTALLTELSKIQDPRFVQSAVNQVNVTMQERQEQRAKPQPWNLSRSVNFLYSRPI
jgi:hypothetical protein